MAKQRTLLQDALDQLTTEAKTCPTCGAQFVYGRKGAEFCSHNCAVAMGQRRYRARHRVSRATPVTPATQGGTP